MLSLSHCAPCLSTVTCTRQGHVLFFFYKSESRWKSRSWYDSQCAHGLTYLPSFFLAPCFDWWEMEFLENGPSTATERTLSGRFGAITGTNQSALLFRLADCLLYYQLSMGCRHKIRACILHATWLRRCFWSRGKWRQIRRDCIMHSMD